jgi:glycosyltransferase involved in cell wall biosynthesis
MKVMVVGNADSPHIRRWVCGIKNDHDVFLASDRHFSQVYDRSIKTYDLEPPVYVPKLRYLWMAAKLKSYVRRYQPDLIHAHGIASAGWLAALSGFHPFLLTAHGSDLLLLDQRSHLHRMATLRALRSSDFLTCVSNQLAEKARAIGYPDSRLRTIYLGVDTKTFQPKDKRKLRIQLNLDHEPIIYHLRSLRPIYNPLLLAQAIPAIIDRFPKALFIVPLHAADPLTRREFEDFAKKHRFSSAIWWLPPLKDDAEIADYLAASDVGISLAESDGTPKSVQEAMSCELPTIAADIPSLREWIRPGQNGLLVPLNDAKSLTQAVMQLLLDPQKTNQIGKNGRDEIVKRADIHKTMRQYEDVYTFLKKKETEP